MSTAYPEIEHELDSLNDEEREAFRIHDDSSASWAMRRLAELQAKVDSNGALHEQEIERLHRWLEEVNAPLNRSISYFRSLLEDYGRRERIENNRKTIVLPHGKVATRPATDKWEFDSENLLTFLKENNLLDLIRTKQEPSLSAMKEHLTVTSDMTVLTPDGEIVPHIRIQRTDFTVSVNPTKE